MVKGRPEKTVLDCEFVPRKEARRSLVLTRDMKAGEMLEGRGHDAETSWNGHLTPIY